MKRKIQSLCLILLMMFMTCAPHAEAGHAKNSSLIPISTTNDGVILEDETLLSAMEEEENKTDRYIIKYKNKTHTDVALKMAKQTDSDGLKSNFAAMNMESKNGLSQSMEELQVDLQRGVKRAVTPNLKVIAKGPVKNLENAEIIILAEKQDSDEYIGKVLAADSLKEIEYIQPDHAMQFAGLENENKKETKLNSKENKESGRALKKESIKQSAPLEEKNKLLVAVLDTGIDISHPDLMESINENGWNFFDKNNQVYDSDLGGEQTHGTHIAGIIAGLSNADDNLYDNKKDIEILPLKIFRNGKAYTSDIIAAIEYAETMGAKIINCSWGNTAENPALLETMTKANVLFITAAGNDRTDLGDKPIYPASFGLPNQITVTSVNVDGGLSYFSNYGQGVEIGALGRNIKSTYAGGSYGCNGILNL